MLKTIANLFKENPVLASLIGLYGAGVLTFLLRNIPVKIYELLKRELTTELTITNQHLVFFNTIKWLRNNLDGKNYRKIKLYNGKYGEEKDTVKTIGYGYHWIFYKNQPLFVELIKEHENQTAYDKESITILKFGRSHKLFDCLIKELAEKPPIGDKIEVYKMGNDYWYYAKTQFKRNLDSIFIEKEKKNIILEKLNAFLQSESWYIENGIPYQFGLLLHGSPGTGKTSLIKAIASYLNYPIYYLSCGKMIHLDSAISTLPDKSIMVIEDIDCSISVQSRKEEPAESPQNSPSLPNNILDLFKAEGLSGVLNSLDGIFSSHGRILIATTNYIEKLDKALLRPGRFDLQIEIGYATQESFKLFLDRFFPNNNIVASELSIKPKITMADLQNLILEDSKLNRIIEFATQRKN